MAIMKHFNPKFQIIIHLLHLQFVKAFRLHPDSFGLYRSNNCLCSFSGLVMLLQDPDPVVRVKAAEAMGHFH